MNILCTILARAGSKGVRNKNIRPINGIPLIGYSIRQAQAVASVTDIAVSSDSEMILDTAKDFGVELRVRRPDELALDTSPKLPAIQHCLRTCEELTGKTYDVVLDLDPTSPLRSLEDIKGCLDLLQSSDASNVITGAVAHRSPYFNMVEEGPNGFARLSKRTTDEGKTVLRRQDSPKIYDMNASIYVWWRESLINLPHVISDKTKLFEMPSERSFDIDNELDFDIVEFLLKRKAQANEVTG